MSTVLKMIQPGQDQFGHSQDPSPSRMFSPFGDAADMVFSGPPPTPSSTAPVSYAAVAGGATRPPTSAPEGLHSSVATSAPTSAAASATSASSSTAAGPGAIEAPGSGLSQSSSSIAGGMSSFYPPVGTQQAASYKLQVRSLPPDVTSREFRAMFALASDFVTSEVRREKLPGILEPNVGYAYFKSPRGLYNAYAGIDGRRDIFAASAPSSSTTSILNSSSSLRCDMFLPSSTSGQPNSREEVVLAIDNSSVAEAAAKTSSRSSHQLHQLGGLHYLSQPPAGTAAATAAPQPPTTNAPTNTGINPQSSRFGFSNGTSTTSSSRNATAVSTPALERPNGYDAYYDGLMLGGNSGMFSPTSPRSMFPFPNGAAGPNGPPSSGANQTSAPTTNGSAPQPAGTGNGDISNRGKSLLLESNDDEDINTLLSQDSRYRGAPPGMIASTSPTNTTTESPLHKHPSFDSIGSGKDSGLAVRSGSVASIVQQPQPQQAQQAQQQQSVQPPQQIPQPIQSPPNQMGPGAIGNAERSNSASGTVPGGEKRRTSSSATRQFGAISLNGAPQKPSGTAGAIGPGQSSPPSGSQAQPAATNAAGADKSQVVVPYSPTNSHEAMHVLQNGGRVLPPANPADQNPPCNTLYVGNLPPDTMEEELKSIFSERPGYKRLCFRTKQNGPMCFVEFEDVSYAAKALDELYGIGLSNSVKGGIRLSYSKNPLGVRSNPANGTMAPTSTRKTGGGNGYRH